MILSDLSIRELLGRTERPLRIEPLGPGAIQPASVDVRLGSGFVTVLPRQPFGVIVPGDPASFGTQTVVTNEPFVLPPGGFCLASTLETVVIPDDIVARVEGKSTIARAGVAVHVTAGYIDPGFRGTITLELVNQSAHMVSLRPGMPIAQLSFHTLTTRAERPYGAIGLGSRYQNQSQPTPGRTSAGTAGTAVAPVAPVIPDRSPDLADFSVDDLGLSARSLTCLKRNGVNRTRQLARMTAGELLSLPNFGPTNLYELRNRIADLGVFLFHESTRPPTRLPRPDPPGPPDPRLDHPWVAAWLNRATPQHRPEMREALGFAMLVTGKAPVDLTIQDVRVIKNNEAGYDPNDVQHDLALTRLFLRYIGVITPRRQAPAPPPGPPAKNTNTNIGL